MVNSCFCYIILCDHLCGLGADFGLFYGGDGTQLGVQLLGVVVITLWTTILSFIVFYSLKLMGWLRVPASDEIVGLDASYHGGSNYNENKALGKTIATSPTPTSTP